MTGNADQRRRNRTPLFVVALGHPDYSDDVIRQQLEESFEHGSYSAVAARLRGYVHLTSDPESASVLRDMADTADRLAQEPDDPDDIVGDHEFVVFRLVGPRGRTTP